MKGWVMECGSDSLSNGRRQHWGPGWAGSNISGEMALASCVQDDGWRRQGGEVELAVSREEVRRLKARSGQLSQFLPHDQGSSARQTVCGVIMPERTPTILTKVTAAMTGSSCSVTCHGPVDCFLYNFTLREEKAACSSWECSGRETLL